MIAESGQSAFSMVAASDSIKQMTDNPETAGLPDVFWNYLMHIRKQNAVSV